VLLRHGRRAFSIRLTPRVPNEEEKDGLNAECRLGEDAALGLLEEEEEEPEEDGDVDELWNQARLHAATREAHLDSIHTIDDLHRLKELHDDNPDMAENAIEMAGLLLETGVSMEIIRQATQARQRRRRSRRMPAKSWHPRRPIPRLEQVWS